MTAGVRLRFFVCYLHRGGYVTAFVEFSGNAANGLRKSDLNLGDVTGYRK